MPLSLPLLNLQMGACFYTASHLFYKPRPDLNIYKANQLESTFVEIINPKKVICHWLSLQTSKYGCS